MEYQDSSLDLAGLTVVTIEQAVAAPYVSCRLADAGARVIKDTVREDLPEGFQTAEYLLEHGFVDLIVERKYLNSAIGNFLNVLLKKAEAQVKNESSNVHTINKSLQSAS